MKNISKIIWGAILIIVGILFALNALNITSINIFFSGWWTLFIIIPCAIGVFTDKRKMGNIIGVIVGVLLMLACRDVIKFSTLLKLCLPATIVILGIKLLLRGLFGNTANEILKGLKENGGNPKVGCAAFSTSDLNYDGEVFEGAELTAAFGSINCDLRKAIIEKDCAIQVFAVFGGIDIFVPENVNVKVESNSIFGMISKKTSSNKNGVTLYISGTCMFGGVEIR